MLGEVSLAYHGMASPGGRGFLFKPEGWEKTLHVFLIGTGMASVIEAQMRVIFSRVEVHPAQATLQSLRGSDLFGVMRIGLKRSDIDIHYSASF
jgi:hypothetical protein